ncbi:MAG: hypothetical protein KO253_04560 [Methanobrevibacter arboriphilus]|nr:hypothetical protein [Methanobrevibacter arboriphilus]
MQTPKTVFNPDPNLSLFLERLEHRVCVLESNLPVLYSKVRGGEHL